MDLHLGNEEWTLLGDLVEHAYRDLKEEVYKTETASYKDELKEREHVMAGILSKLGRLQNAA